MTPAEPTVTISQPTVSEARPSVSPPLSELPDFSAVSIHLVSGQVAKTVAGGQTIAMPIELAPIEVLVQFSGPVDGRATAVTLQQTSGPESWQVLPHDPPAADEVAFGLSGGDSADLLLDVRPPSWRAALRFGVHVAPTTLITAADAGGTVQLK